MKRGVILSIFLLVICLQLFSASLSTGMDKVSSYVDEYNSGNISAPQLIVYIEYLKNKMYEELDKEEKIAFSEDEIKKIFDEKEGSENFYPMGRETYRLKGLIREGPEYEKKFSTEDFDIIFTAYPFYRHDKSYYEQKEEESENYYRIDYELEAIGTESYFSLSEEINEFASDLKNLVKNDVGNQEDLIKRLNKIKQKLWEIGNKDRCEEIMKSSVLEENEEKNLYSEEEEIFYYLIDKKTEKKCWEEPKCEWVCEEYEVCEECVPECYEKEICEEVCENVTKGNETVQNCTEKCYIKEICTGCENEEKCWMKEKCANECEKVENCEEETIGEIKLEGRCYKEESDIHINAWGNFEDYNYLNEGREWNCESEMQSLIRLRKILQKDLNQEFVEWYFEEFLGEGDYDKIINGGEGFRKILRLLTRNEEKIAENLHCAEIEGWPEGFEKIDITYIDDNVHVEVWEKKIPVEWDDSKYYTTLYKYSWTPSKELLKEMIKYQLEKTKNFGPSAKEIAEIKADEGQMYLITSLSEKYGGSFDIKLELKEKEEDFAIKKYLQINPDVAVAFSDEISEDEDISIEIDYDTLYNFINYISYKTEGDKIEGPYWVRVEKEGGAGNFFSVLGAVSKMWKEGVTIKPRYALIKLFFNSKDLIGLLSGSSTPSQIYYAEDQKQAKINYGEE